MAHEVVKGAPCERAMDRWAVSNLIDLAVGEDPKEKAKDNLRRELESVAAELAGGDPCPAERMLADVAAVNWFAYRLFEARFVSAMNSESPMTLAQSEHAQRRMDRAHRRLLASLKALATMRRLGRPTVQVNLAHQQLNVAGLAP